MRNKVLYWLLRLLAWILPAIPYRLAYGAASLAGTLAFYCVPSARAGILTNLAVAFPLLSPAQHRTLAVGAFRTDAINWLDTVRIPLVSFSELESSIIEIEGWQHLISALQDGKGVILVGLHLGNFDLVGQVLAARGYGLTVPVERIEPPQLFDFLTERRQSRGLHMLPMDKATRGMIRALAQGEIVGVMADRAIAGKMVEVNFFGRPTLLPRAPATLARLSGSPLLMATGVRISAGIYIGLIIPVQRVGHGARDDVQTIQSIVDSSELYIRKFPDQWLAFVPLWEPSKRTDALLP
ncbi:MAG: lysophospholipid acyltransferase family protein [Chloroflexota bacterium]